METATNIRPLRGKERMEILDFLRGLAIFGILLVNMSFFNSPFFMHSGDYVLWEDLPNKLTQYIIWFFWEGKFYPLFAVLFGLGFYFFLQKAEDGLRPVLFRYRMRLLYLLIFGILHVVFFWHGDILVFYALFGFVMTWFHKRSDKTLIVWAIIFIILPIIIIAALVGVINLAMQIPEAAEGIEAGFREQNRFIQETIDRAFLVYSTGSFSEIMRMRLTEYSMVVNGVLFVFPNVMSLFLVGIVLGRKKVFKDIPNALSVLKKFFWWCLPVGVILSTTYVYSMEITSYTSLNWHMLLMVASSLIGGPAMMFVYLYLFTLLYHKGFFGKVTQAISKTGRMAFTNYLTQTIICTTIFYSYGLGLYGRVNYWQGILLAIAIFGLQLLWSHYWLRNYRFGPFEWLWRSMTYARWQPLKRQRE